MRPITMRPIACPVLAVRRNARRILRDRQPLGGEIGAVDANRVVFGELVVEARRELALLPVRVERGERVLPAPDHDRPRERQHACDHHQGASDPCDPSHLTHLTPSAGSVDARRRRLRCKNELAGWSRAAGREEVVLRRSGRARSARRRARRAGRRRRPSARPITNPGSGRVAEREEPGDVPRRVPAESVPRGERPDQEQRAGETGDEHDRAHPQRAFAHLWQPEPDVQATAGER